MWGRILNKLRFLLRRSRFDRDLAEEFDFHRAMLELEKAQGGVDRAMAAAAADRQLGNTAIAREDARDAWTFAWLESVVRDVRLALRACRHSPAFSLAVVLTLGIGIGATTVVFSVADAVALRPLPYPKAERLFAVESRSAAPEMISQGVTPQDFLEWRDHQQVLAGIAAIGGGTYRLVEGEPEELRGCRVTGDLFTVLSARPLLGGVFSRPHEIEGNHRVAVLGYGFWQRRFGGDPHIRGRMLLLEDGTYEVLGVMPQEFKYPTTGPVYDLWVPMTFDADDRLGGGSPYLSAIVRLTDDVTPDQAAAHLDAISTQVARRHADRNWRPILVPYQDQVVRRTRGWMVLLLGAAACVLLIACANVAHLMLARGSTRVRELAVRSALGGGRLQLVRQLATESLVLSGAATLLGLVLAWWGVRLFRPAVPASLWRIGDIGIDGRVVVFAIACGVLTSLACGLSPALRGARVDIIGQLKGGGHEASAGRRSSRVREALAFTEVALSFVLAAGASLFILSFIRLMAVDPGFDIKRVINLRISVPRELNKAGRGLDALDDMAERLRQVPGVSGAGVIASGWMFGGGRTRYPAHKPGEPRPAGDNAMSDEVWISPGFFRVLGVPFIRGRDFTDADTAASLPVIIINQTAARRHWPEGDPLGQHLVIVDRTYEVVGVVRDIAHVGSDAGPRPELYIPLAQKAGQAYGTFVVRTIGAPHDVMPDIRKAVRSVWPRQPISRLATLEDDIGRAAAARRFNMLLMTVFGVLALVIAVSGLNGVMAWAVAQRGRELAIRVALGAERSQIVGQVLGRSTAIVLAGIAAGMAGAWALGRVVQSYLFEVRAHDPRILASVGLALAIVAVGACWPPARRASRADPIVTLKAE